MAILQLRPGTGQVTIDRFRQETTKMQYEQLRYVPESEDPSLTIETDELVVKVIDNTGLLAPPAAGKAYFNASHVFTPFVHHLGYHGIRTLYSKKEKRNLVIPFASWLNLQGANLEGLETDPVDERAYAGVGRGWPLKLQNSSHTLSRALQVV